ncbi:hypothetical protein NESM_000397500 [Novymonas esmeraldas]|uniref:Uncharacterized protein n=1 Tax=Novymonas esmeraldas TaxID=1808958 RepID=A0AAW0ENG1_9TRYP
MGCAPSAVSSPSGGDVPPRAAHGAGADAASPARQAEPPFFFLSRPPAEPLLLPPLPFGAATHGVYVDESEVMPRVTDSDADFCESETPSSSSSSSSSTSISSSISSIGRNSHLLFGRSLYSPPPAHLALRRANAFRMSPERHSRSSSPSQSRRRDAVDAVVPLCRLMRGRARPFQVAAAPPTIIVVTTVDALHAGGSRLVTGPSSTTSLLTHALPPLDERAPGGRPVLQRCHLSQSDRRRILSAYREQERLLPDVSELPPLPALARSRSRGKRDG